MQSDAVTVAEYVESLPSDRAAEVTRLLGELRPVMPDGLSEEMGFGMINWVVPLERAPDTYNGKPLVYAALASQKRHLSLYLMSMYGGGPIGEDEFRARWNGSKKLNMGKSCVRFTSVDDIDLDLIKEVLAGVSVDDYVADYERARAERRG